MATQSGLPSVQSTDRALAASLPEPLRTSLRSKARFDAEFDVLGYDDIEPKTAEGRAMVKAGLQVLDAALEPAPTAAIIKAMVRLK